MVLLHVLHLQGLDTDDVMVLDDLGRYLVQEGSSLAGDLLVDTGNLPLLLLIVPSLRKLHFLVQGDTLTTGELTLFAPVSSQANGNNGHFGRSCRPTGWQSS